LLATAKIVGAGFFRLKDERLNIRTLVRTITIGLVLGPTATAPGVISTFLKFDGIRTCLGDDRRLRHYFSFISARGQAWQRYNPFLQINRNGSKTYTADEQ
jgi:hypothetical protein